METKKKRVYHKSGIPRQMTLSHAMLSDTHQLVIGNKVFFLTQVEMAYLKKVFAEYN